MNTPVIIDTKIFHVGQQQVTVLRQHQADSDKPHQVQISTTIDGIGKVETWSYPSTGNPDCDFAGYDEGKASDFVGRFRRFLASVKGQKFATEDAVAQEEGQQ
jgi:hypothetical protein